MGLKTKENKTTQNQCQSNGMGWKGLFWVTVWDERFVFWVTAGPQDAPCRLNNSPGKDPSPWPDKHSHLFQLRRLWQVSCPLPMCRWSSWCWGPLPEATPVVIQLSELLLDASLWQSSTAWNQLSLVFAGAIYLWMIFTVLYFSGIGSS